MSQPTDGVDPANEGALRAALAHQQAGRVQQALRLYENMLAAESANAQVLNCAGVAYVQSGNVARGIELLKRAIALHPGHIEAQRNLAVALREAGQLDAAAAAHRRVLELFPDYPEGYNDLAIVLRRLGKLEEAATAYARALELKPDYAEAHANFASLMLMQDRLDEAVSHYQQAIASDPGIASVHQRLGIALQRQSRLDEAISSYERAISLNPSYTLAHVHLGSAFVEKGEPQRGVECFRRALALDPRAADVHVSLGIALHDLGDLHGALEAYDTSLELVPGNSYALAYKPLLLHELGQHEQERYLLDFDKLIFSKQIEPPDGYGTLAEFNRVLAEYARAHPTLNRKTYRHQGQTGELLREPQGPVTALEKIIRAAVTEYMQTLSVDPQHPFALRWPQRFGLQGWANVYNHGADPHVHPSGWISGSYYVKLPAAITEAGDDHPGWIEFGQPDPRFYKKSDYRLRAYRPAEGLLLLFPSYFWHRIIPFTDSEKRISYAFDLLPFDSSGS